MSESESIDESLFANKQDLEIERSSRLYYKLLKQELAIDDKQCELGGEYDRMWHGGAKTRREFVEYALQHIKTMRPLNAELKGVRDRMRENNLSVGPHAQEPAGEPDWFAYGRSKRVSAAAQTLRKLGAMAAPRKPAGTTAVKKKPAAVPSGSRASDERVGLPTRRRQPSPGTIEAARLAVDQMAAFVASQSTSAVTASSTKPTNTEPPCKFDDLFTIIKSDNGQGQRLDQWLQWFRDQPEVHFYGLAGKPRKPSQDFLQLLQSDTTRVTVGDDNDKAQRNCHFCDAPRKSKYWLQTPNTNWPVCAQCGPRVLAHCRASDIRYGDLSEASVAVKAKHLKELFEQCSLCTKQ